MKNFVCLFFMVVSSFAYSQEEWTYEEQEKAMEKILDWQFSSEDLPYITELIASNKITDEELKGELFFARAQLEGQQFFTMLSETCTAESDSIPVDRFVPEYDSLLQRVLHFYDESIALCDECRLKASYYRYDFLHDVVERFEHSTKIPSTYVEYFSAARTEIKSLGMKSEEKFGTSLSVFSTFGKETWIGGEISWITDISPRIVLKENGRSYSENAIPFTVSGFTVGYQTSLRNNFHDISFNLLEFSSPIHLNIYKFGAMKTSFSPNWIYYYQPEIGFGYRNLSVYYGFNATFKKAYRDVTERHIVGVKMKGIAFPFYFSKARTSKRILKGLESMPKLGSTD